jgi:hypothetical protein
MRPLHTDPITEGRGDRSGKRTPGSEALHGKRPASPPRSRNQPEAGPIDGMRPPFRIRRAGGNPAQEASHAEG